MTRYATISDDRTYPVLVWEPGEKGDRVVARHASLDDLADEVAAGMGVHRFTVPLTTDTRSAANEGNAPVLDGEGAPLWVGARVAFVQAERGLVTINDGAEVTRMGQYGEAYVDCDRAHPIRGRDGIQVDTRRAQTFACNGYRREGALKGYILLVAERGDPYETGTARASVTLAESPLRVCEPVPEPFPATSPSP